MGQTRWYRFLAHVNVINRKPIRNGSMKKKEKYLGPMGQNGVVAGGAKKVTGKITSAS